MNSNFEDYDLAHLRHFFAIAYFQGFSRAARATGLSQPALSAGLKKLETELKTRLIVRGPTEFKLTPDGASLFEFCQEIRGKWTDLRASLSPEATPAIRRLRVGTAFSIGYGPVARMVQSLAGPGQLPLDAEIMTADSYQLIRDLQDGRIDVALLPEDVHTKDLVFETISKDPLVLIAAAGSRIHLKTESWREVFRERTLITYPRDTPMRAMVDRLLNRERIRFRSEVSATGIEAIKLLVQREVGMAFVMKSLVLEEVEAGLLCEIGVPVALPRRGISIASRPYDRALLKSLRKLAQG